MNTPIEPQQTGESARAAVTMRTVEIVVGVLLAALAVLVIVSNYRLGAGWAEDGPEAGYFPLRMGVIILLASIVVIVQAALKRDASPFIEKAQLRLVATVLAPLVVYVAAIGLLGIYVASALFIGIFMLAVGKFSWWKAALVGAGVNLLFFWIFEIAFKVPLPKGPLEQFFGF